MNWFQGRTKRKQMEEISKRVKTIRESQIMQWLELLNISLMGMRDTSIISNPEDLEMRRYYHKLFDETMIELQRYTSKYSIEELDDDQLSPNEERILSAMANLRKNNQNQDDSQSTENAS